MSLGCSVIEVELGKLFEVEFLCVLDPAFAERYIVGLFLLDLATVLFLVILIGELFLVLFDLVL